MKEIEREFLEVDVSSKGTEGVFGGLPRKKLRFQALVDPEDDFAMDNGESKKPLRSDRGVRTPLTFPLDRPLLPSVFLSPVDFPLPGSYPFSPPLLAD